MRNLRRIAQREVTPGIAAFAKRMLAEHHADPVGTEVEYEENGRVFVGRIEQHYHPHGGVAKPWGYHKGVSVLEVEGDIAKHPERAPVQPNCGALTGPRSQSGSVTWQEHVEAWRAYNREHSGNPTPQRMAARWGFSYAELTHWLGREPTTWRAETFESACAFAHEASKMEPKDA